MKSLGRTYLLSDASAAWITASLSGDQLLRLVRADPLMQELICRGGFKATARNLDRPALRRRLATVMAHDPSLTERVLAHPDGPWHKAAAALAVLDTEWLLHHWRDLARGCGDGFLIVAMASDARPAIRDRGLRLLGKHGPWPPTWHTTPQSLPPEISYFSADESTTEPTPTEPAEEAGRMLALNREVASVREALARQREKVRALEHELREHQEDTNGRERELRRELRDARHEAALTRSELPALVSERVADLKQRLRDISQPSDTEMGNALEASDDVLMRIERTLDAQEQLDASFGTREALRRRIGLLCNGARQLATCIEESVRLHPEVRRLHAAVCREIDHLREVLQDDVDEAHTPELAAQISALIKGTSVDNQGLHELADMDRLLTDRLVADLLGPPARSRLEEAIVQRRRLTLELMQGMPDQPRKNQQKLPRELWDIDSELKRSPEGTIEVFVDGYNVTKRIPYLMHLEERDGLMRSRDVFCDLCRAQACRFGHVEVVFDGTGALSAREKHGTMTLVFSNGLGESQNADDYLINRLSTASAPRHTRWLVTDDTGLRHRAEPFCGAWISAADWYQFLNANGPLETCQRT